MPTRSLFCVALLFLLLASMTPVQALERVTIQKAWVLVEATTYQPDGQMWERMEYRYDHLGCCIVAVEYWSDDWGKYGSTFWFSLLHPTDDSAHSALLYLDFFLQHQVPRIFTNLGGNFTQRTASKFLVGGILRVPDANAPQVYRLTYEESKATISGKVERTREPFPTWCLKLTQPLYVLDYISNEVIVCDRIYLYDSTDRLNGIPIFQYDQAWVSLQGQLENYRGGGDIFLYGATYLK
ncbi:MAG: hypothetical protein ACOX57_03360 [Limnochordia bacterium]|jgi:hypothetical protein